MPKKKPAKLVQRKNKTLVNSGSKKSSTWNNFIESYEKVLDDWWDGELTKYIRKNAIAEIKLLSQDQLKSSCAQAVVTEYTRKELLNTTNEEITEACANEVQQKIVTNPELSDELENKIEDLFLEAKKFIKEVGSFKNWDRFVNPTESKIDLACRLFFGMYADAFEAEEKRELSKRKKGYKVEFLNRIKGVEAFYIYYEGRRIISRLKDSLELKRFFDSTVGTQGLTDIIHLVRMITSSDVGMITLRNEPLMKIMSARLVGKYSAKNWKEKRKAKNEKIAPIMEPLKEKYNEKADATWEKHPDFRHDKVATYIIDLEDKIPTSKGPRNITEAEIREFIYENAKNRGRLRGGRGPKTAPVKKPE